VATVPPEDIFWELETNSSALPLNLGNRRKHFITGLQEGEKLKGKLSPL